MKKKILLLAGVIAVCSTAFAGNFNFTNEVKMNDETNYRPDGRKKVEWTLGRGSYKADNGLNFIFDVDRDYVSYHKIDKEKENAWDTYTALYYPLDSFEVGGLTVNHTAGAEFYWDESNSSREREMGLAWKGSTKLNKSTTFRTKAWARNINKDAISGSYDETDMVYGLELDLGKKFDKNWSAGISLDGFWGGYSDGGSTFYNGRDGFNYEGSTTLTYKTDLYKNEKVEVYFSNVFATYWYAQGDDYAESNSRYTKAYVRPEIGVIYGITDNAVLYASTRYNILGQYAFDGSAGTRDANEWETIAGFSFRY